MSKTPAKVRATASRTPANKPKRRHTKSRSSKGILIVGDWIIDHYWFLTQHKSEISASTGFNHYKIASPPGDIIAAPCAAAHAARHFHTNCSASKTPYDLHGLGYWHNDETANVLDLIHSHHDSNNYYPHARFGGNFHTRRPPEHITLHTMHNDAHTIKIIRLYQNSTRGLEQLSRIDWDQRNHFQYAASQPDFISGLSLETEISAIVVLDFGKGAITNGLVDSLLAKYDSASWYVRSKEINQTWIDSINKAGKLFLNFIGPETISIKDPLHRWIIRGRPTIDSMEFLESMAGKVRCIVTPDHQVIVRSSLDEPYRCFVGHCGKDTTPLTQLGWSTAFFSEFAYKMIAANNKHPSQENAALELQECIEKANSMPRISVPYSQSTNSSSKASVKPMSWVETLVEWKRSRADRGIIGSGSTADPYRIELWRGTSALTDYIACIQEKISLIKRIGKSLTSFRKNDLPTSSLSILLTADPGAGKSSLVNAFAKAGDFTVVQNNITQMIHREELLHLFDAIATRQANDRRPVLVFVDEVNALLDNHHVFSSFLAPLEDRAYLRHGRKISLRPCAWIFVGTANEKGGEDSYKLSDKYKDFVSRMTMIEQMDYAHLVKIYGEQRRTCLEHEAKLEQVYLGVRLIRNIYSDVSLIEKQILDSFYALDPASSPARLMRRRASDIRNVQDGRIGRANCTEWHNITWSGDTLAVEVHD